MFKLVCFADVSDGYAGMMIPIFTTLGTNLPYVQEMDEYYISTTFIPFLEYENYPTISFEGDVVAVAGDLGVVAFRRPDGEIFCGTIDTVLAFSEQNGEEIKADPIFNVQVNRLIGADMQHSYDPWRDASASLFRDAAQQKLWIGSEMSFHQKQAIIWRDIRDEEDERKDSDLPGDLREYSPEYLIRWLAKAGNIGSQSWAPIWRNVIERSPFDSRLSDIGLGWIFSNLVENADIRSVKWVLYSYFSMQYYRSIDSGELANFICESAGESEYILLDLTAPEKLFELVLNFISTYADDERFFLFLRVLIELGISTSRVRNTVRRVVRDKIGDAKVSDEIDPFKRHGFSYQDYLHWLN